MKCKRHSRLTKERVDNKSALHCAVTKYALTLIHDQKEDV